VFSVNYGVSEVGKKQRTKYTLKANLDGPKVDSRLALTVDNRNLKNIYVALKMDYDINKTWKDTITANNRVKMNIGKLRETAKVTG